ncbi:MAG TPA: hypothetical protein VFT90_12750 [Chryseosolibacter sp.]|nr:hypothetical protein [Chryseosolibacter sp.]
MNQKKRYLRLDSIIAYMQTELDGDEIFIKYKNEKVAPADAKFVRMKHHEPVPLDAEIELSEDNQWVELELWDYDLLSPNDALGTFRFLVDEVAENFSSELRREDGSEARYVLNWSVVERSANA